MVTIIGQPATVALALDPVEITFSTDKYVTTQGDYAYFYLQEIGNPAVDDTITFTIDGNEFVLTFKTVPDDSGTQLPTNAGALSVPAYTAVLVTAFKEVFFLYEIYDITLYTTGGDYFVRFFAREVGEKYTPEVVLSGGLTGVIELTPPTDGIDTVINSNYKIVADVYIEDANYFGFFTKKVSLLAEPFDDFDGIDHSYIAYIDFKDVLKSYLYTSLPNVASPNSIQSDYQLLKRWYISFYEQYGSPVVRKAVTESNIYFGIRSGINYSNFPSNISWITENGYGKFLTWRPDSCEVSKTELIFLWFVIQEESITSVKIKKTAYFTDGTNATVTSFDYAVTFIYQVVILPAGYGQLSIETISPTKTVSHYDIVAVNQTGEAISEVKRYYVDSLHYARERYLFFTSSLGGFDTLRCTGSKAKEIQLDFDVFDKILPSGGYNGVDGLMAAYNATIGEEFELSVGFKDNSYIEYLTDFLLSTRKYDLVGTSLVPIILNIKSVGLYQDEDLIYTLSFKYKYAFKDEVYSPVGLVNATSKKPL